jgi:hypothetical protein
MTIAEQLEAHKGAMRLSRFAMVFAVSYDCAYDWVRKCDLPAMKINGTYWIDPRLAARWWCEHSTTIAKPPTTGRTRSTKATKVA